jgi:hypothetical protein
MRQEAMVLPQHRIQHSEHCSQGIVVVEGQMEITQQLLVVAVAEEVKVLWETTVQTPQEVRGEVPVVLRLARITPATVEQEAARQQTEEAPIGAVVAVVAVLLVGQRVAQAAVVCAEALVAVAVHLLPQHMQARQVAREVFLLGQQLEEEEREVLPEQITVLREQMVQLVSVVPEEVEEEVTQHLQVVVVMVQQEVLLAAAAAAAARVRLA